MTMPKITSSFLFYYTHIPYHKTNSSDVKDSHNEYDKGAFDTVTRATTNHGLHRGSFQCNATIELNDGTKYQLAYWKDKDNFVTTDGTEVAFANIKSNIKDYKVTGLKFVPVKVKAEDYEALKAKYQVFENGSDLKGGYAEGSLKTIDEVANVTENTNGLKVATKDAKGNFTFSARATGTESGVKDTALKKAEGLTPAVKEANGSYGEFLRVDFTGNYGDLGANMQAVKWTYYGNDSTYTTPVATYGTKFASDNWMHKAMGIQLGLTDSLRCTLPENYDGTGYWALTIYALGYEDYTYKFEATDANIVKPQVPAEEATKTALSGKVAEAEKLDQNLYTEKTWSDLQTELSEAKDALAKTDLMEAEANEALEHLTAAIEGLHSQYVLMNIPYDKFYAADVNNNVKVDAFTSATKAKTRTGSLAAGSYHVDSTGDAINGVTFPVKVTDDFYKDNKLTQITDDSKLEITTTNRGQTSTTTYNGKDALFESADYSYYVLSEVPSYWKSATVDSEGNYSFGKTNGTVTNISDKVTADFTTTSNYGDYQLNLDGAKEAMGYDNNKTANIYGVIVSTDEGNDYGMRHLENIWRVEELAWSTGFTSQVHGCPTSSEHYKAMMGQHINKVTYYTDNGIFEIDLDNIKVPEKVKDVNATVENAAVSAGKTDVTLSIPKDFVPVYKVTDSKGNDVTGFLVLADTREAAVSLFAADNANELVTKNVTIQFDKDVDNNVYTLTVSDQNDKYAPVSTTFELYADEIPAEYNNDSTAPKLTAKEGAAVKDYADFISKIKTVTVNGTDYNASGRGAVTIINEDGTIKADAAPFKDALEGTSFEIAVKATGYQPYTFTYTTPVSETPVTVDTTKLAAAISQAEALKEADYTADSWKALTTNLANAKAALSADDQTKVDNATASLNKAIESLVKKAAQGTQGSGSAASGSQSGQQISTGNGSSATAPTATTKAKDTKTLNAKKTGDQNPIVGMMSAFVAAICLIGAGLFRRRKVNK